METRRLGELSVSRIGLGCNNFGAKLDSRQTSSVVNAALESGINFFDTADLYGHGLSEEYLGRALAGHRDKVIIASKFAWQIGGNETGGASARWIVRAIEDSLRRLDTDYIDLYQQHVPDDETPIEETLGTLSELAAAGKVREIGCSNFSVNQIEQAEKSAADGKVGRFVSVQNHYSLLHREPEEGVLDTCASLDLAFVPFSPLASGMLTGKYRRGEASPAGTRIEALASKDAIRWRNDAHDKVVEELRIFCAERDHTLLELAISWLARNPIVTSVIAGATKPAQVRNNTSAAGWELTTDDLAEIDRITRSASGGQLPRINF